MQFIDFFADLTSAMLIWGISLGAAFWAFAKILEVWLRIKQHDYWDKFSEPLQPGVKKPEPEVP